MKTMALFQRMPTLLLLEPSGVDISAVGYRFTAEEVKLLHFVLMVFCSAAVEG